MLSGKQKKIASKAGNPNKIDAKDFAVLKAEKAKGRGMGLEDEKLKPGKEYVEKAKGGIMKAEEGKLADTSEFLQRRKMLGGTKAILSGALSKTPVGRVAKGIGALAGVGAAAKVSSDMSNDESYKEGMEEGKTEGSSFKERAKKQIGKAVGVARGVIGKKSGGYVRGGRKEIKGLRPAKLL